MPSFKSIRILVVLSMLSVLAGLLSPTGLQAGQYWADKGLPGRAAPLYQSTPSPLYLPVVIGANPPATGLSGSFRTAVTPLDTDNFQTAEFSIWIPESVPVVRGLMLYGPGCGASSLTDQPARERAELSRKWHLAFVGMRFTDKSGGQFCGWSRAQRGSNGALLRAIQTFAEQTRRPELVQAPWLLFGMSGGAGWATGMTLLYPDRVIAAFPRGGGQSTTIVTGTLGVPVMLSSGANDGFLAGQQSTFALYRPQGALWALAVTPNEGHTLGNAWPMALVFFDAVLAQRLPPPPRAGQPVTLLPADQARAWLGNPTTHAIAAAAAYTGAPTQAAWLPDETTAQRWRTFVTTGD